MQSTVRAVVSGDLAANDGKIIMEMLTQCVEAGDLADVLKQAEGIQWRLG